MQQITGTVLNTKMPQTVKIEVIRQWAHPKYHKTVRRRKTYLVQCDLAVKVGDSVVVTPCKPVSKMKKWKVVKVLKSK
jgi:small subunit ribosomal protein S17